ncbi:glycosyl transferase family 1 [Kosakonia radicincitans DSM 16656]|uniref:glycosyltransferase family 4 protein n=1 Tax=Kosakonia TaxID=1330547 RepID=UPI000272EDD2|nr:MULTISPECIES: glycosyltransferase family 4 protein [Kosakonia]ARD60070.1 glycosyl transferase family 1 [Kosakonia radicincitans DSM 16656]KDE34849.1 glycosyl transferase family 1 [Kosakonia radicincitans UMEnt01/12]MDD7993706.1 glycosyltransferase family 4 protein [Kosakonia radicincitans]PTA91462.1 glycosyltransferase family 4 protein [Kosakonia sp. H7A]SES78607.1 Glycosyltransferase involved in cell wall bisynthesis [Kosakonia radicincitans]
MNITETKISLVHEWLLSYAGSEQVSAAILNVYPDAELFSVVDFLTDEQRSFFHGKIATTTFIQKLPKAKRLYQKYLPLMPLAIEQLDVSAADIVISSAHAVAKGVITGPDQLHISYVHSPIRYAWDLQHQYLRESGLNNGLKGWLAKWVLHKMRIWDCRTANGVDHFVANSQYIARRIKKVYGRDADVIYPPVAVEKFKVGTEKSDFYLTASRMVPYKRIGLIVEAFNAMPDKKLIVIGDGPEFEKIKKSAASNVTIMGYQPFDVLKQHMEKAKAFVFAAEEDFGIIPVEAQACGTPVIAFGKGGALETVIPMGCNEPTGVFFSQQTSKSIIDAIQVFENNIGLFTPESCRKNAERFSQERFEREFNIYVDSKWTEFCNSRQIIR